MKIQLELLVEHGVLFISDPYQDDDVPQDTAAAPITFTDTCIAFHVRPYVDGEVHITVSNEDFDGVDIPVFAGFIDTPSKNISISDSHRVLYSMLPVKGQRTHIEIWYYGQNNDRVWVKTNDLKSF
jgi:hypothetical protein